MTDTLVRRVGEIAAAQPEREALIFRSETVTYGQLYSDVRRMGSALRVLGIKKGDRVLFSAVSKPISAEILLAVQYVGAIPILIDKNSTPENALAVYEDAGGSLFFTDMKFREKPKSVNILSLKKAAGMETEAISDYSAPAPEETAEVLFTTGTTGRPKGVMLSYRAVYSIIQHTLSGIGIRDDERILMPLPLHHSYSLRVLRAALYSGACVVLQNGLAFASEVEKNQREHGCTAITVVPVSMELLRTQMQEHFYEIMGRFRYIEVGAGSLTVEQRKRLVKKLPNTRIFNTWGSSETGGALFTDVNAAAADPLHVSAVGRPLPDVEVFVLDERGVPIQSDAEHTGRLALKGEMIMSGYWGQPSLTEAALRDGMLVTNDIVWQDADGYVHMLGRADDIINVGGEKVSPIEVENIAGEYEPVKECICIGVPDEKTGLGQIPILCLAAEASFTEAGIRTYLAGRMERCKIPVHYMLVEAVPRNRMQKPDRKAVRKLWDERK